VHARLDGERVIAEGEALERGGKLERVSEVVADGEEALGDERLHAPRGERAEVGEREIVVGRVDGVLCKAEVKRREEGRVEEGQGERREGLN
jgi:hypothetical protein